MELNKVVKTRDLQVAFTSVVTGIAVGAYLSGIVSYNLGFNDGDEARRTCLNGISEVNDIYSRYRDADYDSNEFVLLRAELERVREEVRPTCDGVDLSWAQRERLDMD